MRGGKPAEGKRSDSRGGKRRFKKGSTFNAKVFTKIHGPAKQKGDFSKLGRGRCWRGRPGIWARGCPSARRGRRRKRKACRHRSRERWCRPARALAKR